jgi:hypothetical protein
MFYQWPKIPINFIFSIFLYCNKAFGFCHIHTFYVRQYLRCLWEESWAKKNCLDIFYESLNFYLWKKNLDFFSRLGKNFEICSNLTCYA